jgi:hypothetical protein
MLAFKGTEGLYRQSRSDHTRRGGFQLDLEHPLSVYRQEKAKSKQPLQNHPDQISALITSRLYRICPQPHQKDRKAWRLSSFTTLFHCIKSISPKRIG